MTPKAYQSITFKLCLTFTLVIILVVAGVLASSRISMTRGFNAHIAERTERELERLAFLSTEIYSLNNSWQPLQESPRLWRKLLAHALIPPDERNHPDNLLKKFKDRRDPYNGKTFNGGEPKPIKFGMLPNHLQLSLLDADKQFITGNKAALAESKLYPIEKDGIAIGYIGYNIPKTPSYRFDRTFLQQQLSHSVIIALAAIALTLALTLPLTRHLTKPLTQLTNATRAMRAGDYSHRVAVNTNDEVGQLSGHFNALAKTLEANETARRQWVADISHELRTPLAVLKAHIEAIQDGIRPATPDNIGKLQLKVDELSRLIDDLYQLSLSDLGALNYRHDAIDLNDFFNTLFDSLTPSFAQAGIVLETQLNITAKKELYGDEARLLQLFQNLLHNSLNYTDKPGSVQFKADTNGELRVTIEDTAPGVDVEHIPKLFDRLYRVEASRNRQNGGAGLGLAICKNIVEAHNGSIQASQSKLGGLKISLTIPLKN